MLNEHIKIDALVKLYHSKQLIEEYTDDGLNQICCGKITKITSDSELEVEIDLEEESAFKKNVCYILYVICPQKVYLCNVYFQSSYSQDGKRIICMDVVSPLETVQRRMHQRVSCHAKILYQILQVDRVHDMIQEKQKGFLDDYTGMTETMEDSLVDISGGGIRFTSKKKIEKGEYVNAKFEISSGKRAVIMNVFGQVVYSNLLRNEQDIYDIRMKYIDLNEEERKQIIHFVFQLERDSRNVRWHRGGDFL